MRQRGGRTQPAIGSPALTRTSLPRMLGGAGTWQTPAIRSRKRGQALVELALLFPIMLLLLVGTVDLGRLFYFDVTVQNAVREGARRAVDYTRTNTEVQAAVTTAASGITVTGITVTPATRVSTTTGSVSVSATYTFTPWMPGISTLVGNSLAVTRTATMLLF